MPQTTIYVSPRSLGAFDTPPPAVATVDLARLFARSPALAGVSLRVEAGRNVALLGPNGAGKTTLLRILATVIRPSFGRAEVDGIDVGDYPELVRGRIAYLSHATGLYDDLTARENLDFAATLLDAPRERIATVLHDIALEHAADRRVGTFSAGMRRRLALGRILLGSPSLVLLDEPYAVLDSEGMELVDALLDAWRVAGATTLVASHNADRLHDLVDGAVHLEHGTVRDLTGQGVAFNRSPGTIGQPAAAGADR